MATKTEEFLTGTGTTIGFTTQYINESDIKVRVDGGSPLTFIGTTGTPTTGQYKIAANSTTITFGDDRNGQSLHIYSETDVSSPTVTFTAGSSIKAADLNALETLVRHGVKESRNEVVEHDIRNEAVTSSKIKDGTIVNADINASADIANTKIADGLLKAGITINSDNIVNGSIVDADVSNSANINGSKLLDDSVTLAKLGSGTLPSDIVVTSTNIEDGTIVNADVNDSANINGTKIATASIPVDRIASGTLPSNVVVTSTNIAPGTVVEADISTGTLDNRYFTETELDPTASAGANVLDARYYTETEADARFYNLASAEEIQSGETWVAADNKVATTAAIDARIIDLVDDVGGFVPIANETSFPTANPDVNNGTGTLVSIKEISTARTPNTGTVTITNGAGTGNTVLITGCGSTVLPVGFGVIVETTSTLHTYTFHRLTPKATETTTVAGISSDVTTVAGIASDVTAVANNNTNVTTVAGSISNVNTVGGSISSVNNASANITSINNFGDQYQVASSNPSTDGGGNALAVGDLFFNTTANELKVYNGTAWQAGVTTTGNFALTTGNSFTGDNVYADGAKATFGTGQDFSIYHTNAESLIEDTGTGGLTIKAEPHIKLQQYGTGDNLLVANGGGSVELYHDNGKRLETISTGVSVLGDIQATGHIDIPNSSMLKLGNSDQLEIFQQASGGDAIIRETSNAKLSLRTNGSQINLIDSTGISDVKMAEFNTGGSCTFKHGATTRLATTSTGIDVTGNITATGTLASGNTSITGDITVSGTVDGRDVAADGTKLDTIESSAKDDQTGSEIKSLYEGESDTNAFTDALLSKLNGIEASAINASNTAITNKLPLAGGTLTGDLTLSETNPQLIFTDTESGHADFKITVENSYFRVKDTIDDGTTTNRFQINPSGKVTVFGDFQCDTDASITGNLYGAAKIGKDSGDYITWTTDTQMDVYINGSNEFRFEADGDFHADGDITAFSTTTASDSRLKTDIHTINDALGIVGKLRGVSYKWLRDGKSDIGVIAQEVEQVIPEIVKTKNIPGLDGMEEVKTVDYGKIVGVLINAVNELKEEIEELKNAKTTG